MCVWVSDLADKPEAKPNKHGSIALQHAMQDNSLDRADWEHSCAETDSSATQAAAFRSHFRSSLGKLQWEVENYVAAQLHALDVHLGKVALLPQLGAEGDKHWRIYTNTLKAWQQESVRFRVLRRVLHAWLVSCIMHWLGLLHCFPPSSCSSRSRFFFSPPPFHADLHVPPSLSYWLIWLLLKWACVYV